MPVTEQTYQEYDQFVVRYRKLILFLCQRASYGRTEMSKELMQECFLELLVRWPERKAGLAGLEERLWIYGRCHVAIDRYLRCLKRLVTVPFTEGLAASQEADNAMVRLVAEDFAATLGEAERRFFLLLAQGASDEELARLLGLKYRTVIQMKSNIKKKMKKFFYEDND
ncbi:MAG: hypothetical protein IJ634_02170 [Bacteroidales bacterium]|nr:hypothetical protein [Bacteroidales bacterium]